MIIQLSGDSSQEPIRLDSASAYDGTDLPIDGPGGQILHVMGWGTTSSGGSSAPRLMEVDVAYHSNPDCNDAYGAGSITDSMMCAASPGQDSCQGDSGGPLIVKRDEAVYDVQVGVVSWGYGCADPRYPGVYARISDVRSWLDYEVAQLGHSLPSPCPSPGSPTPAPTTRAPTPAPTTPPATPTMAPTPAPTTAAPTPAPVAISCPAGDMVQIAWLDVGQEATCATANPGDAVVCDGSFSVDRTADSVTATCVGTVLEVRSGQQLTCAQNLESFGFADRNRGDPNVWTMSNGGDYSCQNGKSVEVAQQTCSSMGARLCSLAELEAYETAGSGCGFDNKPLWTADECTTTGGEPGYMTGMGSDGSNPSCKPVNGGTAAVRCCADKCVSETCAEDLQGSGFADRGKGDPTVWAMSSGGGFSCQNGKSIEVAQETCSSMGARLCLLSDLENLEAGGSGCGFDNSQTWTGTACTTDAGEPGYFSGRGSDGNNPVCEPTNGGTAAVRCCADTCSA
eukprot:scaffold28405_cov40-Prasinocladus_malaysianus.AAC.1